MSATATALIYLVMWSVVLTFALLTVRISAVMRGEKELNGFQADGRDLAGAGSRITRAHANSLENLAGAASLMLLAIASGHTAITDGLAMALVVCRVVQSGVHMVSIAKPAVMVRATAFSVQIGIWVYWGWQLCGAK